MDGPLVLGETGVNADRGEVTLLKELVELGGSGNRLDEDADLEREEGG